MRKIKANKEKGKEAAVPPSLPLASVVEPLLDWYASTARQLPWRENPTPYTVWISEVMLQQTRVEAVIPYYRRFLAACPTVEHLAAIDDDTLLKLWQGLGYYSRAKNLKKAAIILHEKYHDSFPADYAALRALPGIGDYTAGAIASISFGLPEPAVDGNVLRIVTRLTGDDSDVLSQAVKRRFTDQLRAIYPKEGARAAALTQAWMELGQTICLPHGAPRCDTCPLGLFCIARSQALVDRIPYRSPKAPRRVENRTVLVVAWVQISPSGEEITRYALCRRPSQGILSGMWEFPCFDSHLTVEQAVRSLQETFGISDVEYDKKAPDAIHRFTHKEWHMIGYRMVCRRETSAPSDSLTWATVNELRDKYAVPGAYRAYLNDVFSED